MPIIILRHSSTKHRPFKRNPIFLSLGGCTHFMNFTKKKQDAIIAIYMYEQLCFVFVSVAWTWQNRTRPIVFTGCYESWKSFNIIEILWKIQAFTIRSQILNSHPIMQFFVLMSSLSFPWLFLSQHFAKWNVSPHLLCGHRVTSVNV